MKSVLGLVLRLKHALRPGRRRARVERPPDPRVDANPWLQAMLDELGERYRLGNDTQEGIQVLCRTGRERFNPMRAWLRPDTRGVAGDYDVHIEPGKEEKDGRALLDRRVTARLSQLGLKPTRESVEEWAGLVLTRRYEGICAEPNTAAAAVAFICRGPEQVMHTAAES